MPGHRGKAQPKAKSKSRGRGRGSSTAERSRSPSAGITPPGLLLPVGPAVATAAPPPSAEQVESSHDLEDLGQPAREALSWKYANSAGSDDDFLVHEVKEFLDPSAPRGDDAEVDSACIGDLTDHTGDLTDGDKDTAVEDMLSQCPQCRVIGRFEGGEGGLLCGRWLVEGARDDGRPEELPEGVEHYMVQEDQKARRLAEQAERNRQAAVQMAGLLTARRLTPDEDEQSFPPAQPSPLQAPA